jgi:hypothetical protein
MIIFQDHYPNNIDVYPHLNLENINILSVRPLYVQSNMTPNNGLTVISPTQCAKGSINKLGICDWTCGHWYHRIQFFIIKLIPVEFLYILKKVTTYL